MHFVRSTSAVHFIAVDFFALFAVHVEVVAEMTVASGRASSSFALVLDSARCALEATRVWLVVPELIWPAFWEVGDFGCESCRIGSSSITHREPRFLCCCNSRRPWNGARWKWGAGRDACYSINWMSVTECESENILARIANGMGMAKMAKMTQSTSYYCYVVRVLQSLKKLFCCEVFCGIFFEF